MPDVSQIHDLVEKLCVRTEDAGQSGRPLLVQLRRAVWGDIGQTRSGASQVHTIPVNGGAFDLFNLIVDGDDERVGVNSICDVITPSVVVNLLIWQHHFMMAVSKDEVTPLMIDVAAERLQQWVDDIEEHFDPSLSRPLRDFHCPNCGDKRTHYYTDRGKTLVEGEAIIITLERGELVARCRNPVCTDLAGQRSKWTGDTQVIYMARRAGIDDVEVLAEAVREARKPQPELPYDPEAGKTIRVQFDPDDAEHMALRKVLP